MPVSADGEHSLASSPVMPVRDDGASGITGIYQGFAEAKGTVTRPGPAARARCAEPEHDDPQPKLNIKNDLFCSGTSMKDPDVKCHDFVAD